MPTLSTASFLRPKSWDEFENIWWDLLSREWRDPNAVRHGRPGQRQNGVDIYGRRPDLGGLVGVQCKLHIGEAKLTYPEVTKEVVCAEGFDPPLAEFMIVTSSLTDAKLQGKVRKLNESRRNSGKFEIVVRFWQDVERRLAIDPDIALKHYSEFFHALPTEPLAQSSAPHHQGLGSTTKLSWFVSSRMHGALAADRQSTIKAIEGTELVEAWYWERDGFHDGEDYLVVCCRQAAQSDGLFLILGKEITPGVKAEFWSARESAAACLVLVRELKTRDAATNDFIATELSGVTKRNYRNTSELRSHVIKALQHEVTRKYRIGHHQIASPRNLALDSDRGAGL